jgi:peptidoglycan/xylan/chitin deacetylase (PgdA/CDA1 family)
MRRSISQRRPVQRPGRLGTAVGALVFALTACAVQPGATPSVSPGTPANPSPVQSATESSATRSEGTSPTTGATETESAPPSASSPIPTASSTPSATAPAAPSTATSTPTTRPSASPAPTAPTAPAAQSALLKAWAGHDIEAFDTGRKVVALTFDGGASGDAVESILATLKADGVPATFFVTGDFARAYPHLVTAIAAAGHPVGNHSDSHPYFTQTTNEEIRAELAAAESAISALTGATTAPLFRFPFGDREDLDIRVVNAAGYIPVRWTVDTLGWKGTSEGVTTALIRERIIDRLRPGQIVLMHVGAHPDDHSTLDADALPGVIEDLRARGYSFTTVPDLLDDVL